MRTRSLPLLVSVVVTLVLATTPAAAVTVRDRAVAAAGYLASRQVADGSFTGSVSPVGGTADAVLALVAARRGPGAIRRAIRFLADEIRAGDVDTVGPRAKVVLAAVAAGHNPRRFGGRNLVFGIRATLQSDGRYGAATAVFDQALAIAALAGARAPVPAQATTWLAEAQCDDGGWQYDEPAGASDDEHCWDGTATDFFQSDTNTTALAVQALRAVGSGSPAVTPFRFFRAARDPVKKGWGYDLNFNLTDANSTALVLEAYEAAGRASPRRARRALYELQYRLCGPRHGAFAFGWEDPDGDGTYTRTGPDTFATTGAILGVLEQPLPVPAFEVRKPARLC